MFLSEGDKVFLTKEGVEFLNAKFSKLPVYEQYEGAILEVKKYGYSVGLADLGVYYLEEEHVRRNGFLDRYRVEFTLNGDLSKEDIKATDSTYAVMIINRKYANYKVNILGVHLVGAE